MKYFWAPWRMKFILEHKKQVGCVFCNAVEKKDGSENFILTRSKNSFVIMNIFPYNSGHLMVIPTNHGADFTKLDSETLAEMNVHLQKSISVLKQVFEPVGFNIGMNLGEAGGAGVLDHLHYHVVPRWAGDTNFMPVIGEVKVLPATVEDTYHRLKPFFT